MSEDAELEPARTTRRQGRAVLTAVDGDGPAGIAVVNVRGELTLATAPMLRDAILKRAVDEPTAVVVDLTELSVTRPSLLNIVRVAWERLQAHSSPVSLHVVTHGTGSGLPVMPSAVPAHRSIAAAVQAISAPPARLRALQRLPAALTSPGLARRFVTQTCAEWPIEFADDTVQSAVIVVNELVENVICHTPVAEMAIRLEWCQPRLHVAVRDADLAHAVLREREPGAQGGFGLLLVAQLSHTWGCSPHPAGGKVVWATLPNRSRTYAGPERTSAAGS